MNDIEARVRAVLSQQAGLEGPVEEIASTDNLYTKGMTSHASVNVMLQLEDEFDMEFPERLLTKQTFSTIHAISETVAELVAA